MTPKQVSETARKLLSDELVQQLFADIEQRYKDRMINTEPADHEERERCYQMVRAVRDLQDELRIAAHQQAVTDFNNSLRSRHK